MIVMLVLCFFAGSMRAEKNLTVYEGTDTQGMVPVAGINFQYYNKSQYVIPAADLKDMVGSGIYCLIYYLTDLNGDDMMKGDINVYLKEVNYTTISQFESVSSEDLYYEGALTMTKVNNTRMVLITLKKPFFYNGSNLLIDFENPEKGESKGKKFYGKTVTGASIAKTEMSDKSKLESGTPTQYNFIPQTTFLYYPCPVITGVNTTPTSATINWTGENNSYRLRYSEISFFDDFEKGLDGWTVVRNGQGTNDTDWQIIQNNDNNYSYEGNYGVIVYSYRNKTSYNVDNWLITPQVKLGGQLKYWVRVGDANYPEHYKIYVSTTEKDTTAFHLLAEPGDASSEWTEVTVDLSAYEGQMGYIAFRDQSNDQYNMLIDNVGIYPNNPEWTVVEYATSPYTIDNLKEDHSYLVKISGLSAQNEEVSWAQVLVFTEANPTPYDINVNRGKDGATITWTGFSDSYQFYYRMADRRTSMSQNFENGYKGWKRHDCIDGSQGKSGSVVSKDGNAGFAFLSYQVHHPQYLISPKMAKTIDGTQLSFYYKNYHTGYPESFMVGYSSTTDDIDAFTFGNEVTGIKDNQWTQYKEDIPDGTKYVCIKYTSENKYYLFVDCIEINKLQTATNWTDIGDIFSPSITLNDLNSDTQYEFTLRGLKDSRHGVTDLIAIQTFTTQAALQLANNDAELTKKNIDILEENWHKMAEVQLTDRTLLKDGYWNTLCLPFSLTAEQIAASSLAGATIKAFNNSADGTSLSADGTLTMKFNTVTDIEAGVPYLIRWNKADGYDQADKNTRDIKDPVFTGVTITCTEPISIVSDDEKVSFVGQYSPFEIVNSGATGNNQGNKNEILLMSSGNKIGYSKNARTIDNGKALKCFRSHFKVATENGQQARNFVLDFDEGYETTGILMVEEPTSQPDRNWYTLDGRKLYKMPTKKGLYISNGKKFTK